MINILNQLVVVGRVQEVEISEEFIDGQYRNFIELKVPRNFKNAFGKYETDYIKVEVIGPGMRQALDMIKAEDLIGIKARVVSESDSDTINIVAEKITLLKSASK